MECFPFSFWLDICVVSRLLLLVRDVLSVIFGVSCFGLFVWWGSGILVRV